MNLFVSVPVLFEVIAGVVLSLAIVGLLFRRIGYRRGHAEGHVEGYEQGKAATKILGAYCDVCNKVAEKFIAFKMHIVCESCFSSISANKEMKCKFCGNHVEQCSCT